MPDPGNDSRRKGLLLRIAAPRNRGFLVAILLLACVLVAVHFPLWTEILDPPPYFNDNVLHLALVRAASEALDRGADPTDFWFPLVTQGYPLFHHYQHLPHVALAGIHWISGLSVETLFRVSTLLMLWLFPLSVALSVWWLGLGRRAGALSGLAAALLSSPGLYGLDLTSFGWAGLGMTTQLWGMVLLGPAWAATRRAILGGKGLTLAAALLAVTILTHTVLGWVAVLSTGIFALAGGVRGLGRRGLRLVVVVGLACVLVSYFVVPFLQDREAMNRSIWENKEKYDAYGLEWTCKKLVRWDPETETLRGELFDHPMFSPRLPVLTCLLLAGLVVCGGRWMRGTGFRCLALLFAMWFLLFLGRPFWKGWLDLLPLSRDLHFHRLIAPVHLAGAGLAGVALAAGWQGLEAARRRWFPGLASTHLALVIGVLTAALLLQAVTERYRYIQQRKTWWTNTREAFDREGKDVERLLQRITELRPGRAYAGRAGNWGHSYRIGGAPVYALATGHGLDTLGYLYHALSLNADIEGYLDESRPAHFNLFNVRYVVAPADKTFPDFVRLLERCGRHRLYAVETRGYFDLVDAPMAFQGTRKAWYPAVRDWLHSNLVDLGQHPVLFVDREPAGGYDTVYPLEEARDRLQRLTFDPKILARGEIHSEAVGQGRYEAEVGVKQPCYLMLKATYHPGWQVEVDGKSVDPVMLAPAFVGVPVLPGTHRVVFHYRTTGLRRTLFWLGLLVLLAAAVGERFGLARRITGRGPQRPDQIAATSSSR